MTEQPTSQPGELLKPWEQAVMEGKLHIPCRCEAICTCDEPTYFLPPRKVEE